MVDNTQERADVRPRGDQADDGPVRLGEILPEVLRRRGIFADGRTRRRPTAVRRTVAAPWSALLPGALPPGALASAERASAW
jgi:hypothetical protein